MKRTVSALLVLVFLFSFASCKKEEEKPSATSSTAPTTTQSLTVTVTFPEGYTVKEIAELLEKKGICNAAKFISVANDIQYLKSLGYSFISGIKDAEKRPYVLEGYLFPDTYEFYRDDSAEGALRRFLDNTESKLNAEYKKRAKELGYTIDEIISLASIIQEESSEHKHMSNVSSVIHNRLESADYGKLECDVTINYINDNVRDSAYILSDAVVVSEYYNTYKCTGLPLGPICNPGLHAIEAALFPAETGYFFFVTDKDWNYYFSESYTEHLDRCYEVGIY